MDKNLFFIKKKKKFSNEKSFEVLQFLFDHVE